MNGALCHLEAGLLCTLTPGECTVTNPGLTPVTTLLLVNEPWTAPQQNAINSVNKNGLMLLSYLLVLLVFFSACFDGSYVVDGI